MKLFRYATFAFATVALVSLAGCATGLGTGFRDAATSRVSEAYDESLHNAEIWVCRGASAGSVVRRYGASDEQWEAWKRLCRYEGDELSRPVPGEGGTSP